MLAVFGVACGYMSVMVLAIYISAGEAARLYQRAELMWLACPLLLFWVTRVWMLAQRGEVHGDPVVFALKDGTTWGVALITLALVVGAA